MKKIILTLVVLLFVTNLSAVAQKRKGGRTLTLAMAQRVLNQQINEGTFGNVLLTCRACYSPDDKAENDNFPIVSTYDSISQFLARKGYVRINSNGDEFFTAKAKRSQYFEAFADGGRLAGAGFRFANFKNPKITVKKITNLKNVPIEYDFVPTNLTKEFFGATKRVKSVASFSYEDGSWSICIDCNN
jgi:hypothetical protein